MVLGTPAKGKDTFHSARLLQVPSSLALDTCRDPGSATASLGSPCRGLSTLTGWDLFPTFCLRALMGT